MEKLKNKMFQKKWYLLFLFFTVQCNNNELIRKNTNFVNINDKSLFLKSYHTCVGTDTLFSVKDHTVKKILNSRWCLISVVEINNTTSKDILIPVNHAHLYSNKYKGIEFFIVDFDCSQYFSNGKKIKINGTGGARWDSKLIKIKPQQTNSFFCYTLNGEKIGNQVIDSTVIDISYIKEYDTIKQFIYCAKSNIIN